MDKDDSLEKLLDTILEHEQNCLDFVEDPLHEYILKLKTRVKVEDYKHHCIRGIHLIEQEFKKTSQEE